MTGIDHPDEDSLVLLFYGETDAAGDVAGHVEACDACKTRLQALQRTLAVADRHRVPERGEAYGAEVWSRVQARLEREPSRGWRAWFAPRRLALAGSVAVLVIAAFVAGRYSATSPGPKAPAPARQTVAAPREAAANPQVVRDRVLLVAIGDHLERSQVVLVELMNRPASDGPVDISATQQWARDLVPTNRLIRQTADEADEPVISDVLDDLERALIEIANSPSHLSKTEFEQVRQRIDGEGLVFKIRVLDSQVRDREIGSARPVRTRS